VTSRFERRLARIEKLQRPAPEPAPDPRGFVLATLVGFYWCDRGEDEHPLEAYSAAAKGPDGEAGMHALLDGARPTMKVRSPGQVGGSNLPAVNTGSECTQSNSLMPGGRITMNKTAPVIRPPTCTQ
jgi:hypothetical protein